MYEGPAAIAFCAGLKDADGVQCFANSDTDG